MSLLIAPLGPPEHLFGLGDVRIDGDRVRGSMRTAPWTRTEDGAPAAGALAVLVDVVVGHAALFARPDDHWAVTTALALEVARPVPPGGVVDADGALVGTESGAAMSTGAVRDADGRTVAIGTTWVRFAPGLPDFAEVTARPVVDRAGAATVLETLRGSLSRTADGRWRVTLPPDPAVLNAVGIVHGGVVAAAAEVAAAAATADAAGSPLTTAGLRLSFLRPVTTGADGAVELVATVEHRGRTTSLTTVDVHGADGRRAAVASVTGRAV